ncbi:MAG: malate dehydrogenase [Deltaproteobacteria bacterium]|nr:malate dehydrogenase [Candidatus Tharpella aukensis]
MKRKKITIIGAGNVGAACAHWLVVRELGDIVLFDAIDGLAQGKALDLFEATPVDGCDVSIVGTTNYKETANSDIVIIAAGLARKPGMSRDDLLEQNGSIVSFVTQQVVKYSPDAFLLVVTNPLDAMTYVVKQVSGFPKNRVMGMAGMLDTARMRSFIALELQVSVEDVSALVLGGHGLSMLPLARYSTVSGIPLTALMSPEKIDAIIERTRNGGAEIVSFLKTGSAFYAPAAAVGRMVEAILKDKKRILPVAALLEGEYGISGCYVGVPVKLGGQGVEEIIELDLLPEELAAFEKSQQSFRSLIKRLKI